MRRPVFLLLCVAALGCSSGDEPAPPPELRAEEAVDLIVIASSVPRSFLDMVTERGADLDPSGFEEYPLSVLALLPLSPELVSADAKPPPRAPNGSIWYPAPDYDEAATLFPARSIGNLEIEPDAADADLVRGSFTFWDGECAVTTVEFTARHTDGEWKITEFFLPEMKRGTRLEAGGWTLFE